MSVRETYALFITVYVCVSGHHKGVAYGNIIADWILKKNVELNEGSRNHQQLQRELFVAKTGLEQIVFLFRHVLSHRPSVKNHYFRYVIASVPITAIIKFYCFSVNLSHTIFGVRGGWKNSVFAVTLTFHIVFLSTFHTPIPLSFYVLVCMC